MRSQRAIESNVGVLMLCCSSALSALSVHLILSRSQKKYRSHFIKLVLTLLWLQENFGISSKG